MILQFESDHLNDYLSESSEIDYSNAAIAALADELYEGGRSELAYIQAAFEYVRDRVAHSWDIQGSRVTCAASDVLHYGEGICYAKSHLLCALLRNKGIPAGICYQRLTLGDTPDTGHVIHALNAVYISSLNTWIRLDARGNKAGVDAQFSTEEERLAFSIRDHYGEIDYRVVHAAPHPSTIAVLKRYTDVLDMYLNRLPEQL
ncbi:transglutaminase-like domain-containing protein [Paenibacillus kobensis]|uniref:transglutaminase-like domain-containing protein n=1 Tax=Paenibacillus kobensis TaxID=59841 RepID=UPI000FD9F092|nr:transglutaminase family protein [Paenibacillus kobensis]